MRSEPPPTGDFGRAFRAIWEAKHLKRRRRLELLEADVLDRYDDFHLSRTELELLPRLKWKKLSREALRHCYDGGGSGLALLKKVFVGGLSTQARMRCPYCMMRQPGTIDHFLPLDHYPEFAVLVANWVFVCERCNRRKGAGLVDQPRSVLNPYFDGIPAAEPLLYADVSVAAGSPVIAFLVPCPNPTLPKPELAAIAERQVAALGVIDDMRDEAGPFVSSTIGVIVTEATAPLSASELADRLQARRRNVQHLGVNGWELAVIEALERCPDLLALMNEQIRRRPPLKPLPLPRDLGLVRRAAAIAARR